jgi:hypothetical protein
MRVHPQPNHPVSGKAGLASRLAIEYHCSGLPEPGRYCHEA